MFCHDYCISTNIEKCIAAAMGFSSAFDVIFRQIDEELFEIMIKRKGSILYFSTKLNL